ncbi:hypothetical protein HJC23_010817 [Cyclotella cryptica]|uniref:Uncharacterized protein n=1 Tax=Cyclotella cryptica TaxID=29204 RepID=A0ABD3QSQ3_9STRA
MVVKAYPSTPHSASGVLVAPWASLGLYLTASYIGGSRREWMPLLAMTPENRITFPLPLICCFFCL